MLAITARPKEEYEAFSKAKAAIVQVLEGETSYDDLDTPLDEEDHRARRPVSVQDGNLHRDLGPPQEETVPLDDVNPFPSLEPPVEF